MVGLKGERMAAARAHVEKEGECQLPWKKKELYVGVHAEKTYGSSLCFGLWRNNILNNYFGLSYLSTSKLTRISLRALTTRSRSHPDQSSADFPVPLSLSL